MHQPALRAPAAGASTRCQRSGMGGIDQLAARNQEGGRCDATSSAHIPDLHKAPAPRRGMWPARRMQRDSGQPRKVPDGSQGEGLPLGP